MTTSLILPPDPLFYSLQDNSDHLAIHATSGGLLFKRLPTSSHLNITAYVSDNFHPSSSLYLRLGISDSPGNQGPSIEGCVGQVTIGEHERDCTFEIQVCML